MISRQMIPLFTLYASPLALYSQPYLFVPHPSLFTIKNMYEKIVREAGYSLLFCWLGRAVM